MYAWTLIGTFCNTVQLLSQLLITPVACRGALMGSAPSDSLSTGSEEGSAGDSSSSIAYNASLKPLKARPPGQPGDLLPAEAILEQFDRAQQYVLKNKGEFTAEQQAKLQVKPEL